MDYKRLLQFLMIFLSTIAAADAGIDAAYKVCQSLNFSSDISECTAFVSQADSFDAGAVENCKKMTFPSEKQKCLEAIKDKTYSPENVASCGKLNFGSEILECLKKSGKKIEAKNKKNNEDSDSESKGIARTKKQLKKVLDLMEKQNYGKAKKILENVLEDLE